MSAKISIETRTLILEALISHIGELLGPTDKIVVNGVVYTAASVASEAKSYLPIYQAVVDSRADLTVKVQARNAIDGKVRQFVKSLKAALVSQLTTDKIQLLGNIGLDPPKPRKKATAAANKAKADKAAETRLLRGTKGKNQKKSIKAGDVPPPASNGGSGKTA